MTPINFFTIVLSLLTLKGYTVKCEDESQIDYHLPSKVILSNIIRQQNRPSYIQKCLNHEDLTNNLEGNILTQFLNRFQPALDREAKQLMGPPPNSRDHHANKNQSPDRPFMLMRVDGKNDYEPPLWRSARDDYGNPVNSGKRMTQCTKVPGRILCKFGPYTYVINTKDRDLNNEELEKVVGMMHQRIQEGDKAFDLSIVSLKDKMNGAMETPEPFFLRDEGTVAYDSPPIIVECTPVDKSQNKLSDRPDDVEEIVYSCKWHNLKLKRDTDVNESSLESDSEKKENEKEIEAEAKAMTCKTPIYVRKFSDFCKTSPGWCPETTITPCPTSQMPICVPWCNPFLKGKNVAKKTQH